jgi:large subunit ribosomal protein L9
MQLILLEKVTNLGNLGDIIKVKPGYGRNFLIPQGKAIFATKNNLAFFEQKKAELEAKATGDFEQSKKRAQQISELTDITISAHASDEGKLYGSVGSREIANAVTTRGIELLKQEVLLPNGPLRTVGEHEVRLKLHTDVTAILKVNVIGDENNA